MLWKPVWQEQLGRVCWQERHKDMSKNPNLIVV
jgi:hypothetical protein